MSTKEKLLDSAQKFLAKGQLPRAIKDYQKVVELDPKDIRSRQKLAELYSRARMISEAIDAFEAVAKYYSDNGFYLKAIAVYKQMQRLDPARPGIYQRLAELNVKQGLVGNALAEYRTLVSYFEKKEMLPEALGVLQKMKELEPENLNIRVKIIDTHLQAASPDNARSELAETVALLEPKKDFTRLQKLYEFFLPKFEQDSQLKIGLARVLIRKGEPKGGIELLKGVLATRPADEGLLRLLAEGYRCSGEFAREQEIFDRLLRKRPDDLDLLSEAIRARLDAGEFGRALDELEKCKESFWSQQKIALLRGYYERVRQNLPNDPRVGMTLRTIYEMTGEGGKLFDIISASTGGGAGATIEEVVASDELFTDSVLEEAVRDTEGIEDTGISADEHEHAEEIPLEFLEGMAPSPPAAHPVDTVFVPEAAAELELELEFELDLELKETDLAAEMTLPIAPEADLPFEEIELSVPPSADFFDLRSAVLDGDHEPEKGPEVPEVPTSMPRPKKGIKTDVDVEDAESRYNLGIAYKEMGLLDDAINEFDRAMSDPSLAVACQTLKGICLVEKGAFALAEETFRRALEGAGLSAGERMGLNYELGLLYEGWSRPKDALDHFQEVALVDLFFRDAGEKVRLLRRQMGVDDVRDEKDGGRKKDRVSYV